MRYNFLEAQRNNQYSYLKKYYIDILHAVNIRCHPKFQKTGINANTP